MVYAIKVFAACVLKFSIGDVRHPSIGLVVPRPVETSTTEHHPYKTPDAESEVVTGPVEATLWITEVRTLPESVVVIGNIMNWKSVAGLPLDFEISSGEVKGEKESLKAEMWCDVRLSKYAGTSEGIKASLGDATILALAAECEYPGISIQYSRHMQKLRERKR